MESAPQVDDERMLNDLEYGRFVVCMFDLLHPHNTFLIQNLDRIEPQVVLASHCQENIGTSEGAEVGSSPRCTRPKLPVPSVR